MRSAFSILLAEVSESLGGSLRRVAQGLSEIVGHGTLHQPQLSDPVSVLNITSTPSSVPGDLLKDFKGRNFRLGNLTCHSHFLNIEDIAIKNTSVNVLASEKEEKDEVEEGTDTEL